MKTKTQIKTVVHTKSGLTTISLKMDKHCPATGHDSVIRRGGFHPVVKGIGSRYNRAAEKRKGGD